MVLLHNWQASWTQFDHSSAASKEAEMMNNDKASLAARCLICTYFANEVYEQCELYTQMATTEMKDKTVKFPERYPPVPFPYLSLLILLPCVVLIAVGVKIHLSASVLMVNTVKDTASLLQQQM